MLFQSALYFPFLLGCLAIYWLVFRTSQSRMLFIAAASIVLLITLRSDQSPLWVGAAGLAGAIKWSWAEVSPAVERILIGMAKKFLLVDLLLSPMLPAPTLIADGAPTLHAVQVLAACFLKLLVTYFDFSGYTDMVLGTARLFGFKLIENFDFPLLRSNLAEFWRSWHISLSSWARDYVYLPILGRYRMTGPALLATMLTIGVWHGAQPGWALWGLHHGTGLVLYGNYQRWCESRPAMQRLRNRRAWRLVSMVFVWWFVSLGYALTFTPATFASSTHLYVKALSFGLFG
jgi:alginate O-acetyltransferase complex protein AlgI